MLQFRDRLSFKVYNKKKKSKYGIKFYELTTSGGYLLNTEMYSGPIEGEKDIPKLLVLRLLQPYINKGHELFMDNFYNSYGLSEKLLGLKTHTTGTLRVNRRDNPTKLTEKRTTLLGA